MSNVNGIGSGNSNQSNNNQPFWSERDSDSATAQNRATTADFSNHSADKTKQTANQSLDTHPLSNQPTSTEQIANEPTTTESLAAQNDTLNLGPLAGPAAMAARREFTNAPLNPLNAFDAYKTLSADDFAGPDDMRLNQLSRSVQNNNLELQMRLSNAVSDDAIVGGRAKTPFSTFGKLRESFDASVSNAPTIGDIKDLSGLRVDVTPSSPDFFDVYQAQTQVTDALGPDLQLKQDYISQPNSWGYTGRVHSNLPDANGLTHEVQVGARDISTFIDGKLKTTTGQQIPLHDVTGYKGQIYGVSIPGSLQDEYSQQLSQITETNRTGQSIADVPAVQTDVNRYLNAVEQSLPDSLNSPPAPTLSARARIGNVAGKGFGVLDIAGSGFQAANGIQTLRSGGDTVVGVADVSAGTTGVVSGVALLGGRVALGTATGGVVATIDGAKDIYIGVRDGNVEKTTVGVIKSGAGAAMLAGVATANPILIAGGAIAYGGAAIYESRDAIASAAGSAWNWTKSLF